MKKRSGFFVVVKTIAQERINRDECPACGFPKEKWKRRKDWRCCSKKCTDEYWRKMVIYYGWSDLRRKVFERDNYTCVKCKKQFPDHLLVGDHIIPIAIGGDEWDIDNVQTLCKDKCNKIKTKQDAKDIAKQRRIEEGERKIVEIRKNHIPLMQS